MNIRPTQMRFMRSYDATEVRGLNVNMNTTNSRHINTNPQQQVSGDNTVQSFGKLLTNALGQVNQLQINATNLQQQAITNPGAVNVHQVMNALAKAEMSLGFLKSVNDKVVSAFKELTNLR